MSLQKELILRHQKPGHVRFQVPERICEKNVALYLERTILQFGGVYRVNLYRSQKKLSIRYSEEICSFTLLMKELFSLLADFEKHGCPDASKAQHGRTSRFKETISGWTPARWAKDKYSETKETAQAVGVLAKFGLKNKKGIFKDPEKTIIDFSNDVLVLYLIKKHWQVITGQWILKPIQHRYEWIATFYMMYLLMRSKIPKK